LTLVADASQVCMVNNQFMGRQQIPIEVEGKTYFGCCEMCKGRLAKDPSSRSAKDPVSGELVDKASAVIAKKANGEVLYFKSNETFERYRVL
jgi:YHS domain-containing protein